MYQKPKGTQDLLPQDSYRNQELENIFKSICLMYNYKEMRTPIFERSEVFHRTSGAESDIVKKETYDFVDRGSRNMTLRPEGTAGIVRAYVENKMHADALQVNKIYYVNSPMFRYERPQSGRLRQHTQYGIEAFSEENPFIDAEVISIAYNFLKYAGIKNMVVKINTLGDEASREAYKKALVDYLNSKKETLCEDCKRRIETNPLRALDCKVDTYTDAPKMSDYRSDESKVYFENLMKALEVLQIPYEVDETLVRGLDYYSATVFEVQATIEGFGAKATLIGGGRYSNLVETLGGPKTSSIGFGCGIERLLLALEAEKVEFTKPSLEIFVAHTSMQIEALDLTVYLRDNGFITEMDYTTRKLKNQLNYANKLNAKIILVVAEDEYQNNSVILKVDKKQVTIKFEELVPVLEELLNTGHSHEGHECSCGEECSCGDECSCERENEEISTEHNCACKG